MRGTYRIHIHNLKFLIHSFGSKIPSNVVPSRTIFFVSVKVEQLVRTETLVEARKRAQQRSIVQARVRRTLGPLSATAGEPC